MKAAASFFIGVAAVEIVVGLWLLMTHSIPPAPTAIAIIALAIVIVEASEICGEHGEAARRAFSFQASEGKQRSCGRAEPRRDARDALQTKRSRRAS